MDERVEKALQQWPDVPDVHGWLSLDRRGLWRLRGETISNPNLISFINRNYVRLDSGSYAFQNGPQRVHVALEATPWIAHLQHADAGQLDFFDHTGRSLEYVRAVYLYAGNDLIFDTPRGPALLCDQDLAAVARHFCDMHRQPLSDTALDDALEDPLAHGLQLPVGDALLALQALSAGPLGPRFDFVAKASR